MASHSNPEDVAGISEQVHRIALRYPEASNAVWGVFLVFGFLLIIPVVFGAIFLCAEFRVNGALALVGGVAVWLGLFMLMRQAMFWRRQGKVSAFASEFRAEFPEGPSRETALACLARMDTESNEVVAQVREQLGAVPVTGRSRRSPLKLGAGYQAGQGLEAAGDATIDRQVEEILRPLDARMRVLSAVQYVVGLGGPIAFFVLGCIFEPEAEGLLWGSFVILVVWNIILAFILSMVESPATTHATEVFQQRFPKDQPERAIAMAALSRISGMEKAKSRLRSNLRGEEDEEDEGNPARTRRRSVESARMAGQPPPAPVGPPSLEPMHGSPALDVPAPDSFPVTMPPPSGAILLEPAGQSPGQPPPPPPSSYPPPPPSSYPPPPPSSYPPPPPPPPTPPQPPGPAAASHFCRQCGSRLKPENRFCTGCGAHVS